MCLNSSHLFHALFVAPLFFFSLHSSSSNVSHWQAPSSRPSLSTNQQYGKLTITPATRYRLDPPPWKQRINTLRFSLLLASLIDCDFFFLFLLPEPLRQLFAAFANEGDVWMSRWMQSACCWGHISGTWVGLAQREWPLQLFLIPLKRLSFRVFISTLCRYCCCWKGRKSFHFQFLCVPLCLLTKCCGCVPFTRGGKSFFRRNILIWSENK